jgi:hypothetical protein
MITLITSLLVSFSNDELNRILQSDAIKNMALTASMSQSMISIQKHSLNRGKPSGNARRAGKHKGGSDDEDSDSYDDDSDEVHIDRYDDDIPAKKPA